MLVYQRVWFMSIIDHCPSLLLMAQSWNCQKRLAHCKAGQLQDFQERNDGNMWGWGSQQSLQSVSISHLGVPNFWMVFRISNGKFIYINGWFKGTPILGNLHFSFVESRSSLVLPQLQCAVDSLRVSEALRLIFHVVSFPVPRSQAPVMGTVEIEKNELGGLGMGLGGVTAWIKSISWLALVLTYINI